MKRLVHVYMYLRTRAEVLKTVANLHFFVTEHIPRKEVIT
jgi:hypothetical protein